MNKKSYIYIFACLLGLSSCSDWTDTESVDININETGNVNKTEYYKDLRAYKQTNHKITYLAFDNSVKNAYSDGQLLTSVPDSIDYVSLSTPAGLTDKEIASMASLKEERAYAYVYKIDIDAMKNNYNEQTLAASVNGTEFVDQTTYISDSLKTALSYSNNFDGLVIGYLGKDVSFLTQEERALYVATENAIIASLNEWATSNPNKFITLEGYPQYWADKTLLNSARHIILNSASDVNADKVMLTIANAGVTGVPTDKFILAVNAVSFAEGEGSVGYWTTASGTTVSAITQMATIANSSTTPYPIKGISVNNGSNDYYNSVKRYLNVRNGIDIMNPSLKN